MANQDTQKNHDEPSEDRLDTGVPQPPHFQRKLQIAPLQLIGISLLALLPILAIFSVFGESLDVKGASNSEISMQVEYVTRYRYRMQDAMSITVTNESPQPSTITVSIDRDYINHFSDVTFVPEVERVSVDAYEVDLPAVKSHETRLVTVQMQGEHYWTKTGVVSATLTGGQPVTVEVSTTIFP